jgi:hypothetical protein
MGRRKLTVEKAGSDAAVVRLLGDRNQPEPSTFIVQFPGGEVEISRTTGDDYWVHVRPNTDDDVLVSEGAKVKGRLARARVDHAVPGGRVEDGEEIGFAETATHVAVLCVRDL